MPEFPNLTKVIQQGIDRNLHTGVQVYVSLDGRTILDEGFGMATPHQMLTPSTIMLWRSAGKPIMAAAICRLCERGRIDLDAPLNDILTEPVSTSIGNVTIRQILTHTTGLPVQETGWPHESWKAIIARVTDVDTLSSGSAYQPQSTWFLLGELLQQLDPQRRSLQNILREDVLNPLGLGDVWCGIEKTDSIAHRMPSMYSRENGRLSANNYATEPWLTAPSPGGNFRGPVRELGRFYEMLLMEGQAITGNRFLQPETVTAMTTRHRSGVHDTTFQHVVDFGLGLIIDSNAYGLETVPYGFGQFCSEQTFGHGGAQCAMGFCDPDRKLVVAWAANGFCGEGQHQRRNRAINEALYVDLGFN